MQLFRSCRAFHPKRARRHVNPPDVLVPPSLSRLARPQEASRERGPAQPVAAAERKPQVPYATVLASLNSFGRIRELAGDGPCCLTGDADDIHRRAPLGGGQAPARGPGGDDLARAAAGRRFAGRRGLPDPRQPPSFHSLQGTRRCGPVPVAQDPVEQVSVPLSGDKGFPSAAARAACPAPGGRHEDRQMRTCH